ncbi:MAG: hypothetical protein ACJ75Z_10820 [Solirubrobacterales bacterium]
MGSAREDGVLIPWSRTPRAITARELLIAFAGLLAAVAAVYLPHAASHGLYTDDWWFVQRFHFLDHGLGSLRSMLDVSPFPGGYGTHFSLIDSYRPGQTASLILQYLITGESGTGRLLLSIPLAAIESFLLYLVMRMLGLRPFVAGAAAGIMAIGTFVDSTRLWSAVQSEMNAASLYLAGLACALAGLRSTSRARQIAWHAGAVLLYLACVFTYEAFLLLLPLSALGYVLVADRRAALFRWAADLVAVGIGAVTVGRVANRDRQGHVTLSHVWHRIEDVIPAAGRVFGWSIPGESIVVGPLGILLAIAAAVGVGLAIRRGGARGRAAVQWCAVGAVAFALALVGVVPLLPAEHALTPANGGFGNRLLVTSSLFYPLLYVSIAFLIAIGLGTLIGRPRWAPALAVIAIALLAVGLVNRELQRQDDFSATWDQEQRIVDSIQRTLPSPKRDAVIVSFRHPLTLDGGMVSFATDYDLDGALKLRYGDESIRAHPYLPGATCGPTGMTFSGTFEPANTLPYDRMYFVDTAREKAFRIDDAAQCTRELERLTALPVKFR